MEITDERKLMAKAGSAYSHAWRILWDNFISLFLVALIIIVAATPYAITARIEDFSDHFGIMAIALVMGQIFTMVYTLFVMSPLSYGSNWVYLKAVRKEKFEVQDLFDVFRNYINVLLAALLSGAIIVFGFFFLIIPGIIFACRLAFVPYLVMDKRLDAVKAVEESWRLTKGHGWRIFWMGIIAFFVFILGLVCLVFGAIVSAMWISAAFASFYQAVLAEKGEDVIPVVENGEKA